MDSLIHVVSRNLASLEQTQRVTHGLAIERRASLVSRLLLEGICRQIVKVLQRSRVAEANRTWKYGFQF